MSELTRVSQQMMLSNLNQGFIVVSEVSLLAWSLLLGDA